MNQTAIINNALFVGIHNAMIEESYKVPVNSGYSEEIVKKVK